MPPFQEDPVISCSVPAPQNLISAVEGPRSSGTCHRILSISTDGKSFCRTPPNLCVHNGLLRVPGANISVPSRQWGVTAGVYTVSSNSYHSFPVIRLLQLARRNLQGTTVVDIRLLLALLFFTPLPPLVLCFFTSGHHFAQKLSLIASN